MRRGAGPSRESKLPTSKRDMATVEDLVETAIINEVDMDSGMQKRALLITAKAVLETPMINKEQTIAAVIKSDFDHYHGSTWHCIVGKSFGSLVSYEPGNFIYFYIGDFAVLLFKT